ncbi:hypothetical protein GQ54DRAFT_68805 [Martensiomyces pterosporus]|nr:hypothetical protein GQ54DRAFT_68805 [Martensiomyces pterosporus]
MSANKTINKPSDAEIAAAVSAVDEWSFIVSEQWEVTLQSLAIVSLASSLIVLVFLGHIIKSHRKYLSRFSLRISGYVALADMANSITQILMLQNTLMIRQSADSLRFLLWLSMGSTLFFIFLTLSISLQLHLSTLTSVRIGAYMRLERYYVPGSLVLATVLPAIAVSQMKGVFWVPQMHAFNWPGESWRRRLVLWMCNYVWIIIVIIYCAGVATFLSLRIWTMWRDSVEVIAVPRMPEKWDWAAKNSDTDGSGRLSRESRITTASANTLSFGHHHHHNSNSNSSRGNSNAEFGSPPDSASTVVGDRMTYMPLANTHDAPRSYAGGGGRGSSTASTGYLMTVISTTKEGGRPVAVRSFVDKKRFLRSIQRLVCYPLVPIITQLGVVIMNMVSVPTKGMYIYGTAMAATSGILNLVVFLLNPSLPEMWKEAALKSMQ